MSSPSTSSGSGRDAAPTASPAAGAEPGAATAPATGWWQSIYEQNPYFSAGFGLAALGVAARLGQRGLAQGATLARRRLLVTLEISSKDPAYGWFLHWMSATQRRKPSTRTLLDRTLAKVTQSHELAVETNYEARPDGSSSASFALVPGQGRHLFQFRDAWFQLRRERTSSLDLTTGKPFETLVLTALSRDRGLFHDLLARARELVIASQQGRTIIYTAWGAEWRPFGRPRLRRDLGSVVLDDGIKETIVDDLRRFMGRGAWYSERGIPYRRGYLLHGPPGSGKSSFIQALAGHIEYNICVLNLAERGLTDDKLNHLLANAPERSIILLEDIDSAFAGREASGEGGPRVMVTFSGLLNALDGVASAANQRIVFMTTNHLDRLDPALIRPGRVDLKMVIDDASVSQATRLFRKFYAGSELGGDAALDQLATAFADKMRENAMQPARISMAMLQGHFIRYLDDAAEAVRRFEELEQDAESERQRRERGEERVRFASSP